MSIACALTIHRCGRLSAPHNSNVRQQVGFGIHIANFLGKLLIGEPLSPIQCPSKDWQLSKPRVESDANSETLVLSIRDIRYPRMRGKVSIKLVPGHTIVRWRTRAGGGGMVADRPVRISDDGRLRGPMLLGVLCCDNEELKRVCGFLEKQVRPNRDEADPLLVAVPRGPIRPSGGHTSAAIPDE